MTSLVIALDYEDAALPLANNVAPLVPYPTATPEPGALAHWVFDQGGAGGLVDLVQGRLLSPLGGVSVAANHIVIDAAEGKGLMSPVQDRDGLMIWAVMRKPAASAAVVVAGTLGNLADSQGQGLHITGGSMYYRKRDAGGLVSAAGSASFAAVDEGAWVFVAGYFGETASGRVARVSVSGGAASSGAVLAAGSTTSRNIVLGNGYWSGQGAGLLLSVAEFGVMEGAPLTSSRAAEMYGRAKARMAERGISII